MKKMKLKTHCDLCGEKEAYQDIRPLTVTYKKYSTTIQQPGMWCDHCGEGVIDGEDHKSTREELQAFRSKIDGLLSPEKIYRIRKKVLKLTQKQAGKLFGGGSNAFGRYERGETPPSRAVSHLLHLLSLHPEQLEEIYPEQPRGKEKQKSA